MERARRPPKAGNRAHIPRAIASREAMLWQGCSLSPSELERKPPRSVWATELPASRPIRWIVRESREANLTDFARIPSDGLRDAPRASTDGLARFLSDKLRSRSRASIGRTHIRNPLARFPTDGFRPHQEGRRRFNHFPTPTWTESTATQPRLNHPSCRIQERFRHNHPTSTILESTTLSCMGSARPSTASAVALLPTPPATRKRSPSCWQCCHERCRRRETQNP